MDLPKHPKTISKTKIICDLFYKEVVDDLQFIDCCFKLFQIFLKDLKRTKKKKTQLTWLTFSVASLDTSLNIETLKTSTAYGKRSRLYVGQRPIITSFCIVGKETNKYTAVSVSMKHQKVNGDFSSTMSRPHSYRQHQVCFKTQWIKKKKEKKKLIYGFR